MKKFNAVSMFVMLFCMFPGDFSHSQVGDGAISMSLRKNTSKSTQKMPKKILKTTGYYKPLKGQRKYVYGSFRKDVHVNGPGKETAFGGKAPIYGRTVATDPSVIKPGTVLHIPGFGVVIAEDGGGAVHGHRADIYFGEGDPGRIRAVAWGKRTITVSELGTAKI